MKYFLVKIRDKKMPILDFKPFTTEKAARSFIRYERMDKIMMGRKFQKFYSIHEVNEKLLQKGSC